MAITKDIYKLGFQISPIILTNGLATGIYGGMLPLVAITEAANFLTGILSGSVDIDLDSYFAQFRPLPGARLIQNQIGAYPFANQTVAANAIITSPLSVSLQMTCPVRLPGGYFSKLLTMTTLKQLLEKHNSSGGTYTVATPSYLYTNCILLDLHDISSGQSKQAQTDWQFDFSQPLITQNDAAEVFNTLISKMSSGASVGDNPTWSGLVTSVGSQLSGAASSVVTAAQNLIGTTVNQASALVSSITGGTS